MAVKFSQFTPETVASNVTDIVGYQTSGNLNIKIPPANLDTIISTATAQAGATVTYTLTGTKTGTANTTDVTTFTASGGVTVTAGTNVINISSLTYTLPITGDASAVTATLTDSNAGVDPVLITAGTSIAFSSVTAAGFTIDSSASGDTYELKAGPKAGSSVPLNLDAAAGADTSVNLTEGTGITLTQNSATEITIASTDTVTSVDETTPGTSSGTPIVVNPTTGTVLVQSMAYAGQTNVGHVPTGGVAGQYLDGDTGAWITLPSTLSIDKKQFTGTGALAVFNLASTAAGLTVNNLAIYISGVYQNKLDASDVANFTVGAGANPDVTFSPAPPLTAANGIEIVITR